MVGEQFHIGFKTHPDAYRHIMSVYGTKMNAKVSAQFNGEDAKGLDCSLTYNQIIWTAFYYMTLMYKDMSLGMSLSDAETKYNIPRLRYVLSCYKIYLSDFYDAFGMESVTAAPFVPISSVEQSIILGDMGGLSKILNFDGSNDQADAIYNTGIGISTGDATIELRFKIGSVSGAPSIISTVSAGLVGYEVRVGADSVVHLTLRSSTANIQSSIGTEKLSINTWYHVVITLDRDGNATLYLNGKASGSIDISAMDSQSLDGGEGLLVAYRNIDSVLTNMNIDRIRLYDFVLSATEVWNLYVNGEVPLEYEDNLGYRFDADSLGHYSWMDKSANENNLVIEGATLYNIPSNSEEIYQLFEISGNTTTKAIPTGYAISKIVFKNVDVSNSCILSVGTSALGTDIVYQLALSAQQEKSVIVNNYVGAVPIYISGTWGGCKVTLDIYLKEI